MTHLHGHTVSKSRNSGGASDRRSRAPEFYGFVALTSTYFAFGLYLLWALLPDEYLLRLGIDWYPSREWAVLIPAWTIVLIITTYVVYSALAVAATPSFSDMSTVTDSRAHLPSLGSGSSYVDSAHPDSIPVLYDIPVGLVNRVLVPRPC